KIQEKHEKLFQQIATVDSPNLTNLQGTITYNTAQHFRHHFVHEKLSEKSPIFQRALEHFPCKACFRCHPITQTLSPEFQQFLSTVEPLDPVYSQQTVDAFEEFLQHRESKVAVVNFLRSIVFQATPKRVGRIATILSSTLIFDIPYNE
ncbi:2251_t:CDS:1, partial [Paraglomus occultum]